MQHIRVKLPVTLRSILFGALLILSAGLHGRAQEKIEPPPQYIPPSCQGKPINTVPRATVLAQTPTVVKPNPPNTHADQLQLFEELASVINETYVYPDFNGQDWAAVVSEFRRKVESGLETEAFYAEMEKFVQRLGDKHSNFQSPVQAAASRAALSGTENYVGIGALLKPLLEKKSVSILAVMPDSAADRNGLRAHDSILAADGLPLIEDGKVYQLRTRGPACSATVLTVHSPGQPARQVTLVRYQVAGSVPIYARLVKTTDGTRIGYIFLPSFFDATLPNQVKQALVDFGDFDGLIIDNRLNSGGASSVLLPILSYFTSGTLGHFVSRTGSRPLEITANPIGSSQKVPLVILVSKETVSFGEIFSGILQDMGRARVIGQASAGRVETLHSHRFGDGSVSWIAQETFEPIKSRVGWQHTGVKPEVEVYADWDTFTFENDPVMAVALKLLGKTK